MSALALAAWIAAATPVAPPAPGLSFADRLAADGDWYRAITEYRRFGHQHPSHPLAEAARLRVGDLYSAAGKHEAAAEAYARLVADAPSPRVAADAAWRAARSYELAGRLRMASAHYDRFVTGWPKDGRADHARYRRAYVLVDEGAYVDARQSLTVDPPGGDYQDPGAALLKFLSEPPADDKSPLAAGILSAVLPGAGQAYAGRWGDGLLALLVNGTFFFGTWQAWDNDNTATAVVMGMFGLGFYVGGVFGGVNAAHRHNDSLVADRQARLRQELAEPHGAEPPPKVDVPLLGGRW